jgi:hypothetical protein
MTKEGVTADFGEAWVLLLGGEERLFGKSGCRSRAKGEETTLGLSE